MFTRIFLSIYFPKLNVCIRFRNFTFLFETAAAQNHKTREQPTGERNRKWWPLAIFQARSHIFNAKTVTHYVYISENSPHTQQNNTHISNNVKCWLLLFICCKMQKPIQRNVGLSDNRKISLVYTLSVLCTSWFQVRFKVQVVEPTFNYWFSDTFLVQQLQVHIFYIFYLIFLSRNENKYFK